jgi:hypothetical protein
LTATDALLRDFHGDEDDGRRIRGLFAEAGIRKSELVGERLGDLLFRREIQTYENCADALVGPLVLRKRDLQSVFGDQTA